MEKGLLVFVCFVEVHLKHFHHLSMLKYLLNLCLEGEVVHPFATARHLFNHLENRTYVGPTPEAKYYHSSTKQVNRKPNDKQR